MLRSFFPTPRLFFGSAVLWTIFAFIIWYTIGSSLQESFQLFNGLAQEQIEGKAPPFLTAEKLWTYQYIAIFCVVFCIFWYFFERNKWYWWSVVGSTFIMVSTYISVQISVFLNNWYRGFYDLIQKALSEAGSVTATEYYGELSQLAFVLAPNIIFAVFIAFYTSHYLFRWRKAMNDYYVSFWPKVRHIEGASQRVQEDTRIFSGIMEGLGTSFVSSIMTLIAFLPVLWSLSNEITEFPVLGEISGGLVFLAILSAILGTVVLAAVGFKLPGLEFENQKVEAAYRKELVYGEDSAERGKPEDLKQLFWNLKGFYFRYFFHFLYFNVARFSYLQGAVFIPYVAIGPTIIAGAITFGLFQQIFNAFNQVENSFQFLVNSWTRIVELMSVYKRLTAFEASIPDDMSEIDPAYAIVSD